MLWYRDTSACTSVDWLFDIVCTLNSLISDHEPLALSLPQSE